MLPLLSMVDRRRRLHRELVESSAAEWPDLLDTDIPSAAVIERMGLERAPGRRVRPADLGHPRLPRAVGRGRRPLLALVTSSADDHCPLAPTSSTSSSTGGCSPGATTTSTPWCAWVDEVAAWPDDGAVAPPPRAHRRRPAAVPHRELRAVPRRPARPAHHRADAGHRVGAPRRAGRALQGEDQLQAARRRRATRRTRTRPPTGSSRPTCRAWSRSTTRWSATAASRWCPAGTRRCCRWTTPAASAPTSSPRSSGRRWRCGRARRCGSTPARRTAAARTSAPTPRRALYPTYNALAEGDLRAAYYEQKRAELGRPARPVSLIGDFQGRPVT